MLSLQAVALNGSVKQALRSLLAGRLQSTVTSAELVVSRQSVEEALMAQRAIPSEISPIPHSAWICVS